jgi:hypothetical protein
MEVVASNAKEVFGFVQLARIQLGGGVAMLEHNPSNLPETASQLIKAMIDFGSLFGFCRDN